MKVVSTTARYFILQIVPAVLLLANRYVPLALTILGAVIFNILCFHFFMAPAGLPLALCVAVLWALVFIDVQPAFSGLFQSRLQPEEAKQNAGRA